MISDFFHDAIHESQKTFSDNIVICIELKFSDKHRAL